MVNEDEDEMMRVPVGRGVEAQYGKAGRCSYGKLSQGRWVDTNEIDGWMDGDGDGMTC